MSGLMLGILFSRPLASLVTEAAGWRSLYAALSTAVAALALGLVRFIPTIRPNRQAGYPQLIGSLGSILREEPSLRQRAATQAMCMGAFGVFWTAIALRLAQPPISLGQTGIALFAFSGAAGAIISPIAGRAGDRGATRPATMLAHAAVATAMILAYLGGEVFAGTPGSCPVRHALVASRETPLIFAINCGAKLACRSPGQGSTTMPFASDRTFSP
ncbi:hypothetical protein [uncultured Sphingomonas sp.]|uniref:hypothetical protein n=1 Tax=uncultured Sphingomonas sp. TaxID=158754 RepID=UPI0025DC16A2|nr:hypothetical protein [uncultured Sphingomonas sp.]